MKVYFFRHGVTEWNDAKRLQGRTDIPLSESGIAQVKNWVLPADIQNWYVSPLVRCRQTAEHLGLIEYMLCPELIEMNWGQWEGRTLQQLRNTTPVEMLENEIRGLDMLPPGGETPRHVVRRLGHWLGTLAGNSVIGAITHKGVIRAAISLATDWDMKSKPPIRIQSNMAYLFETAEVGLRYSKSVELS